MQNLTKGILGSFIIHGGFVLLFFFIPVTFKPPLPEFIEVSFSVSPPVPVEEVEKGKLEPVTLPLVEHPKHEPEIFEPEEVKKEVTETPEKQLPSIAEKIETGIYTITGELSIRGVVHKLIPEYPEGYNIETKVSVRLFVLPDGIIGRMRLVEKGGEPFDKLTQHALREWQFEPLPENVPQITQEGIITFIYKLR